MHHAAPVNSAVLQNYFLTFDLTVIWSISDGRLRFPRTLSLIVRSYLSALSCVFDAVEHRAELRQPLSVHRGHTLHVLLQHTHTNTHNRISTLTHILMPEGRLAAKSTSPRTKHWREKSHRIIKADACGVLVSGFYLLFLHTASCVTVIRIALLRLCPWY